MKAITIIPPVECLIQVEMTEREAETLRIVCAKVGSDPEKSRRKDTDALDKALREAGVSRLSFANINCHSGNIFFNDN